jgi:hypothetical protein
MGKRDKRKERPMHGMMSRTLLIAVVALGSLSVPVLAQGFFGVSAGVYKPGEHDQDRTEVYGLRGGYRFNPSFGLEGSLSRVNLGDTFPFVSASGGPGFPGLDFDFKLDLYNLDLSLQWFPGGRQFLVFGGIGGGQLDSRIRGSIFGQDISDSTTSYLFTAHAGLAYEWRFRDHLFLRPEARVRHYFGDNNSGVNIAYKATDYEGNLAFGWRFGS